MEENNLNKKKNSLLWITIGIIAIICTLVIIYFKVIKVKSSTNNNETSSIEESYYTNTNTEENYLANSYIVNTEGKNNITNEINVTNTTNSVSNSNELTANIEEEIKDENGDFLMAIEDIFTITGKGTVVTGRIERGKILLNDPVQIIGLKDEIKNTTVFGIEMFRKTEETAKAGDNVGLYLKDTDRSEIQRGQVVAKPNSIKNIKKFAASLKMYSTEDGGRHTPFFNGYKPLFYFRVTDITGTVELTSGVETVSPGESANVTVNLESPVAMEVGTAFKIREGGKTIGEGTVTAIY